MNPRSTTFLFATLLLAASCSDDRTIQTGDGGPADGRAVDTAHNDAIAVDKGPGKPDTGPVPDGPGSGCGAHDDCQAADSYCHLDNGCFGEDIIGRCKPKPEGCPKNLAWVCGCDGKDYGNDCMARAAGVNVTSKGKCGGCQTDSQCKAGAEWCDGGECVACDNSGLACDMACINGWQMYTRNGCSPCACAPSNACTKDSDCGAGGTCYAGAMCWDWCPPGDPSCCFGNTCSASGCTGPNPTGCFVTGCPVGQQCGDHGGCASSGCGCSGNGWACDADCGGGTCK